MISTRRNSHGSAFVFCANRVTPNRGSLCFCFLRLEAVAACAHRPLNADQTVVFGDPIGAAGRTRLDEGGTRGDRNVSNRCVLGLPRSVGEDEAVACLAGGVDDLQGLGQRADLVGLDEDGVRRPCQNALLQASGIGHEQIVPDQFDLAAEPRGHG